MPAHTRRIQISQDGKNLKKQIRNRQDFWAVETDERFSIMLVTDGASWAIIEGYTAVSIPNEIIDLLIQTKQIYDEQVMEGRDLAYRKDKKSANGEAGKQARPVDIGKVKALYNAGWSLDRIYEEVLMDGVGITKNELEEVLWDGRD